jgi:hypothetical protein
MTQDLPIACSLNASDLRARLDEIGALGRDALLSTDAGGTMRFRADKATRERLAAIIDAEATCCSFLRFELADEGDTLTLTITAPAGAEPVAHDLTAAFARQAEVA